MEINQEILKNQQLRNDLTRSIAETVSFIGFAGGSKIWNIPNR
jgi:hypothetical protein